MNHIYHYTYKNGLQFVTTAEPLLIGISLQKEFDKISPVEVPKLIGIWKYKKVKTNEIQK